MALSHSTRQKIALTCRRIKREEWDEAYKHRCIKCNRPQLGWRWRQIDGQDYCRQHYDEAKVVSPRFLFRRD